MEESSVGFQTSQIKIAQRSNRQIKGCEQIAEEPSTISSKNIRNNVAPTKQVDVVVGATNRPNKTLINQCLTLMASVATVMQHQMQEPQANRIQTSFQEHYTRHQHLRRATGIPPALASRTLTQKQRASSSLVAIKIQINFSRCTLAT